MPAVPPRARPTATRRAAIALGAAGLLAVAGCDGDDEQPAGGRTPAAHADPDRELVDSVLADLAAVTGLVSRVGSRFATLADEMSDLRRMHNAHIRALDGSPAKGRPAGRVPATASAARTLVRRRELSLQRRLVEAAVSAESGTLARLLASMSAAVSQRLGAAAGSPT